MMQRMKKAALCSSGKESRMSTKSARKSQATSHPRTHNMKFTPRLLPRHFCTVGKACDEAERSDDDEVRFHFVE
jgi:hypothetical protein